MPASSGVQTSGPEINVDSLRTMMRCSGRPCAAAVFVDRMQFVHPFVRSSVQSFAASPPWSLLVASLRSVSRISLVCVSASSMFCLGGLYLDPFFFNRNWLESLRRTVGDPSVETQLYSYFPLRAQVVLV